MMEAARSSETLVNFYQTTRHYNPEDSHLVLFFGLNNDTLSETWTWNKADRLAAAEMRYLKITEGKIKVDRIRSEKKVRENLKVNTSEGKLTNNRIKW
jgi:hypothetical protein